MASTAAQTLVVEPAEVQKGVKSLLAEASPALDCHDEPVPAKGSAHALRKGEIEFPDVGGHRCHYIITDKDVESPDAILQWMFTDPNGWKLTAPSLMLSCWGGRDHYVNWADTVRNRSAWSDKDDFKFRKTYANRLGEIAGGMCQAICECNAWFDTEDCWRGGLSEVLADGFKAHWARVGSLVGHKTDCVVLGYKHFDEAEFGDKLLECSVPVGKSKDAAKGVGPEEKRMIYPSNVSHLLFPEMYGEIRSVKSLQAIQDEKRGGGDPALEDASATANGQADQRTRGSASEHQMSEFDKEVRLETYKAFLCRCTTHLILFRNKQCFGLFRKKLLTLSTRAVLTANGNPKLIMPGIGGVLLQEASRGTPIIVLSNTGGAAEMLADAVMERRGVVPKREYDNTYALPENIPDEPFIILNPAKDSVEKVINKLTMVLSSAQDDEMMEIGFQKGERNRIVYAWELYMQLRYNADYHRRLARRFFYSVTFLAVLITLLSLLHRSVAKPRPHDVPQDSDADAVKRWSMEHQHDLKLVLLVLPAVSGFILTMQSKFNPMGKWASLESGAVQVQSEIYQYRCRVLEYTPRQTTSTDIEERIYDLLDNPPALTETASPAARKARKRAVAAKTKAKPMSRRAQFSLELDRLQSDAVGGELHSDSLMAPPSHLLPKVQSGLYNSAKVRRKKKDYPCCNDQEQEPLLIEADSYVHVNQGDAAWNAVGSDFEANPHVVEEDYLRDDGLNLITAEDYVHFRMLPWLQYYNRLAPALSRKVMALQIISFLLTAFLTVAAALEWQEWVPLVVALLQAVAGTLAFENYIVQLRNVNQSLEALRKLRIWWQGLSMVERRMPASKEQLVSGVEATVDAEISAFKKSMKIIKSSGGKGGDGEEEDEDKGEKAE